MGKTVAFTPFKKLADYDYGVKGFEVRFQEMIEKYLEESGIKAPWWKYYEGSIFREVLEIYELEEEKQDHRILINLHEYYQKVTEEVARRVRENDPVSYATFKRGRGLNNDPISK